jgi:hypothetical protein
MPTKIELETRIRELERRLENDEQDMVEVCERIEVLECGRNSQPALILQVEAMCKERIEAIDKARLPQGNDVTIVDEQYMKDTLGARYVEPQDEPMGDPNIADMDYNKGNVTQEATLPNAVDAKLEGLLMDVTSAFVESDGLYWQTWVDRIKDIYKEAQDEPQDSTNEINETPQIDGLGAKDDQETPKVQRLPELGNTEANGDMDATIEQPRIEKLVGERDYWVDTARNYCKNADYWRERAERAEAELAQLKTERSSGRDWNNLSKALAKAETERDEAVEELRVREISWRSTDGHMKAVIRQHDEAIARISAECDAMREAVEVLRRGSPEEILQGNVTKWLGDRHRALGTLYEAQKGGEDDTRTITPEFC